MKYIGTSLLLYYFCFNILSSIIRKKSSKVIQGVQFSMVMEYACKNKLGTPDIDYYALISLNRRGIDNRFVFGFFTHIIYIYRIGL